MIYGAPDQIHVVGKLVRRDEDDTSWAVRLGLEDTPLWLDLLPYEGRQARLEWVVGAAGPLAAPVVQEGRLDFSQGGYLLRPKSRSRRVHESWRRQQALLRATVLDAADPAVLSVYGFAFKEDSVASVLPIVGSDGKRWDIDDADVEGEKASRLDLAQLLQDGGFLGVEVEMRIVSELRSVAVRRCRLSLGTVGELLVVDRSLRRLGPIQLDGLFEERYSLNDDRVPTNFCFRKR